MTEHYVRIGAHLWGPFTADELAELQATARKRYTVVTKPV
jgi:hypothetical protein